MSASGRAEKPSAMLPPSPTPVLLDDAELLRIATTARARLFPTLNRASAFAPLIVVCCVIPALQLLAEPTLNEEASLWGLRGLAVSHATNVWEFLQAGINEQGSPLLFQPPLASWLNGLVIDVLGPTSFLSSSLVSLVATGISIWLMTRLAWRVGGANTALVAGLLMCSHWQVLEAAIAPTNAAVGSCLLLASVFGLQRHLEGKSTNISSSLAISGIVWGLCLLAIGPVAFCVPLLFVLHASNQRLKLHPQAAKGPVANRLLQGWMVLRSTAVMVTIGCLVGLWWEVFMRLEFGRSFSRSWWSSLPIECLSPVASEWRCDLCPFLQPKWQEWIRQQALLIGWLIVGLERCWHEWRSPSSEMARRRYQLLMLWWGTAFVGRILMELVGTRFAVNSSVWNLALLSPTILLSALGIGTLIERAASRRGEFCLIVLLVCLTVTRLTSSWGSGLLGAGGVAMLLIWGPFVLPVSDLSQRGWSEKAWRQLLQITVYGSLFGCLALGLGLRCSPSINEDHLAELRNRLSTLPDVQRISLLVARDPVPVSLKYLLRSRWPDAELATSEDWDPELAHQMSAEATSPRSRFLVVEWTRREIRLAAETGMAWQITAIGDPMRFFGRRLSLIAIEPRK